MKGKELPYLVPRSSRRVVRVFWVLRRRLLPLLVIFLSVILRGLEAGRQGGTWKFLL